ncbi:hypothetical protein PsYK624_088100 [Phanerochaete sordida]|uniref:Uncharacterized protein n=1 Tax=Phanerochaete sordida TaxID=48140 RepID=A0A9P3GF74_9APHY|nr:hypothetical protein PsYK624_088100 [Phanerochaete sordida]
MKFSTAALSAAAILAASVSSIPVRRDVPVDLVPQFGVNANVNPTGTGDCDGIPNAQGVPIKIPCACPPDRNAFIAELNQNVNAGFVINNPSVKLSFPTDSSTASAQARINAAAVTLQNLHGPGQGCPIVSTTFTAQSNAINAGQDPSTVVVPGPAAATGAAPAPAAASPAPAAPAPPANNAAAGAAPAGAPSAAQIAQLAPPLGFTAGKNPTGTGDCDGAVNDASGNPIKVPCTCPPSQDVYLAALTTNVQAGKAVNNPSVAVSFPTGSSKQEQAARIEAALVTIQNLNGPGVGCPAASTTLSSQLKTAQS